MQPRPKWLSFDAGALGAAVGESIADYYITPEKQILIDLGLMPNTDFVELTTKIKLATGTIALLTNVDVNTAVNSGVLAAENNAYLPNTAEKVQIDEEAALKIKAMIKFVLPLDVLEELTIALQNGATYEEIGQIIGTEGALYLSKAKVLDKAFTFLRKANKACFVAGTLVETIDGLRPIETIAQGDLVWSRHEETMEYGYRPVTATNVFTDKDIYEVVVKDDTGKTETYQTTEEHPFWVVGSGWMPAHLLQTGMTLINRDNQATLTVVNQTKLDTADTVYNFTVDEFHTYHIGEFGVWVHNDCFTIKSSIKESRILIKEAEIAGKSHQKSIDHLTAELKKGNLNPGIGSKPIGKGFSEARARDGARVYFRKIDDNTIEIVGKSNKANQQKVINEILRMF